MKNVANQEVKLETEGNIDKTLYNAFIGDGLIDPMGKWQKTGKRLPNGLLEGFQYEYGENGRINWQALINPEYLVYPNNDPTRDPLPKVDGLRDLAEVRGVEWKEVKFQAVSESLVVVSVKMKFIPNLEDPNGRTWEAVADAGTANVDRKFSKYLATIAETRATGRCIREALGIRLCTFEEIAKEDLEIEDPNANNPIGDETIVAIKRQMELKGVTTDDIMALAHKDPKNKDITSLNQLTIDQGRKLLRYVNELKNEKTQRK